ncbi:MAG: lipocalin family protein [Nonlabens sp.]|uniref:lipocalin family protein n=1 Tax=Nonlabens sp. TaxID=1888209 RepID=UPI003EF8A938
MKKLILPLLAGILLITSCSDNSNQTTNSNAALVGNYVLTTLTSDVAVDLNQDMATDMELTNETTCFDNMAISFNADGTFTSTVAEVSFDNANVLQCNTSVETGTYSYGNGLLTITVNINGGTATESQQVVLTATTLSFNVDDNDVAQYFSGAVGTPASSITSLDFVYTKI